jgi:hypothetical protein
MYLARRAGDTVPEGQDVEAVPVEADILDRHLTLCDGDGSNPSSVEIGAEHNVVLIVPFTETGRKRRRVPLQAHGETLCSSVKDLDARVLRSADGAMCQQSTTMGHLARRRIEIDGRKGRSHEKLPPDSLHRVGSGTTTDDTMGHRCLI